MAAGARVTDHVSVGTVSLPHGYAEANVNVLIRCDIIDELSGMPRLAGTIVEVTPFEFTPTEVTQADHTGAITPLQQSVSESAWGVGKMTEGKCNPRESFRPTA